MVTFLTGSVSAPAFGAVVSAKAFGYCSLALLSGACAWLQWLPFYCLPMARAEDRALAFSRDHNLPSACGGAGGMWLQV